MLNRDETSFSASDFHIVGFSLGAQVAGKAGAVLNGLGKNLARITGLDPAGLYKKEPISNIFHLCSLINFHRIQSINFLISFFDNLNLKKEILWENLVLNN